MSKKAKTKKVGSQDSVKGAAKKARKPEPTAELQGVQAPATDATNEKKPRERDSRLPPVGTVLRKLARDGSVRCECTVDADGIRYTGKLFRSLSGAAMAAAKDLGLSNKTANGWNFWGITKPAHHSGDPLAMLARAWERYRERAASVIAAVKDDDRARARELFGEHAEALKDLCGRVA